MLNSKSTILALLIASLSLLSACTDGDDGENGAPGAPGTDGAPGEDGAPGTDGEDAADRAARTLQLLHFADIDGAGGADDVRNFSALVDGFRNQYPSNTLVLSSGDNFIPGPEYMAAAEDELADVLGVPGVGRVNIAWLNALGTQATALGNHDLDPGPSGFADIITADGRYPGALFPYLSANTDFSGVPSLDAITEPDGQTVRPTSVAGSATLEMGGQTYGLVGASAPSFPAITSTGDLVITPADATDIQALAEEIQLAVDALTAQGIDRIILLAHMQQIAIEQQLATLLSGVDIIIAGGSNTILADANDRLRESDAAADTYPLQFSSASSEPVLVVNTAGDFRYLGRLVVEFDDNGVLMPGSIDPGISGAYASDVLPSNAFQPIPRIVELTDALQDVLQRLDGNVLGVTGVYLDGRRSEVRTEETNLGNLTADANLFIARLADNSVAASLKNGGGIRDAIGRAIVPPGSNNPDDTQFLPPAGNDSIGKPEGGVSQFDIQNALRFDNGLSLLTLTAAELADVIEYAVSATAPGATPGQFPQVGGLRFSFDPEGVPRSAAAGQMNQARADIDGERLRTLALVDDNGNVIDTVVQDGMVVGDVNRPIRLVALSFTVQCVPGTSAGASATQDCGDGYPLKGLSAPDGAAITDIGTDPGLSNFSAFGGEQDALGEYLAATFPAGGTPFDQAETDPADDLRIQNLNVRDDSLATP